MERTDRFVALPPREQEPKAVYAYKGKTFSVPCDVCRAVLEEERQSDRRRRQGERYELGLALAKVELAMRPRGRKGERTWRRIRREGMAALREILAGVGVQ